MNKVLNIARVTGLGLILSQTFLLTGCSDPKEVQSMRPIDNKWKAKAERKSFFQTITYSKGSAKLSVHDKSIILSNKNKMRAGMPIYVRLLVPQGERIAEVKLIDKRIREIEGLLTRLGIKKDHIDIRMRNAAVPSERSTLTVVFDQYHLVLPQCPGWEGIKAGSMPHGEEAFGCSMAYNVGLMVSNPKDLYEGQNLDTGDGPYLSSAVERYRKDKTKDVKVEKIGKSG